MSDAEKHGVGPEPSSAATHSQTSSIRDDEAAVKVQLLPTPSWKSCLWDSLNKSPEERRFLAKLDGFLLTYACLGEFLEALDSFSINNAYVSGMRNDMNMYGNELNYCLTTWTVGYVIGQVPSNLLLTRVRPRFWIPTCQLAWSLLVIVTAKCTSIHQIYALRFCIGLLQSSFYPGVQFIIGSWYRKDELAKRSCIFPGGYTFGTILSGLFMAAIYQNLNGKGGYQGWQWLFIINTAINVPIALAGFFILPDIPEICCAWYLTKQEVRLSQTRMALEGRATRGPYTRAKIWRILTSWHIYLLSLSYILYLNGCAFGSQPAFSLWLKSKGYSQTAVTTWPAVMSAITLVVTVVCAWTSDSLFRGERWPPLVFSGVCNVAISSCMAVWNIPDPAKFACFILIGLTPGISGMFFAWAHEICSRDNEERALVTATMNKMAYLVQAWLPLLIWPTTEAPRYPRGYISMVFFGAGLVMVAFVTRWLDRRERALRAKAVQRETAADGVVVVTPSNSAVDRTEAKAEGSPDGHSK